MTTIRSAARTVASRCAMTIVVRSAISRSSASWTSRSLSASNAEVASSSNSNGASGGSGQGLVALATSTGFARAVRSSYFSCSASVIAGEAGNLQRDYASHSSRFLEDLDSAEDIGRKAGERAAARLNPARPPSGHCPVIFDPRVSPSLLGHFVAATF